MLLLICFYVICNWMSVPRIYSLFKASKFYDVPRSINGLSLLMFYVWNIFKKGYLKGALAGMFHAPSCLIGTFLVTLGTFL